MRHPDTQTVQFTVELKSDHLNFLAREDGKYEANLRLAVASLNARREIRISSIRGFALLSTTPEPSRLPNVFSWLDVKIREPRDTAAIRVVIEDHDGGAARCSRAQPQGDRCSPESTES